MMYIYVLMKYSLNSFCAFTFEIDYGNGSGLAISDLLKGMSYFYYDLFVAISNTKYFKTFETFHTPYLGD